MKKVRTQLTTCLIAIVATSLMAQIDTDFEFDSSTGTITAYALSAPKVVNIPQAIGGVAVLHIGHQAFYKKDLKEVNIPDGVQTIASSAFSENHITKLTIGKDVTSIGDWAFNGNPISEIIFPDGLQSIGESAFNACQISNIVLPSGMTSIAHGAFYGNKFTELTIGENITNIADWAFGGIAISSLTFEEHSALHSISSSSFNDAAFTSVKLPTISSTGYYLEWKDNDGAVVEELNKGVAYTSIVTNVPAIYTITYNLNGGENGSANVNEFTVETPTITLDDATKINSTFDGWYNNENFEGDAITTIAHGTIGNIVLWAKWGISSPIDESISDILNIYPTIVQEELTIEMEQMKHGLVIDIISLSGQKVYQRELNSTFQTLNLAGLKGGIYLVKIGGEMRKIIKR